VSRVNVFGSLNADLVAYVDQLPKPGETRQGKRFLKSAGGKGLNQAIAAARAGARVTMVGAVGDDDHGRWLKKIARSEGIEAEAILEQRGQTTGVALISVDNRGENNIIIVSGANDAADPTALKISQGEILLAQLETPLSGVVRAFETAKAAGALTILNPAPAQELPPSLLRHTDIVIPNEHEAAQLTGIDTCNDSGALRAAQMLRESGAVAVVITLGSRGALLVDSQGPRFQPPFAVMPVDTTAAGDAFCGALAASLSRGETLDYALAFAAAAGGLATTVAGATPSLPLLDEILNLLTQGGHK